MINALLCQVARRQLPFQPRVMPMEIHTPIVKRSNDHSVAHLHEVRKFEHIHDHSFSPNEDHHIVYLFQTVIIENHRIVYLFQIVITDQVTQLVQRQMERWTYLQLMCAFFSRIQLQLI
jgi:hypothetical protein